MNINEQRIPSDDERYFAGNTAKLDVDFSTPLTDGEFLSSEITFTLADQRGEEPLITKTQLDSGITVTDPNDQLVEITVRGNETSGLGEPRGKYYDYEITLRDPSGNVSHVITGPWVIHAASATLPDI